MRCVRMGSRAADESAATEGARPDDGGQDDSGSEVDAWASSGKAHCATDQRRFRGKESAAPCVSLNAEQSDATTSPRDGLRAPVQAAHRPPSRDRRRRGNDRPTPPGPACNEGGF